jgi:photosystem II stability/assembly factor-like uncharacterized protein
MSLRCGRGGVFCALVLAAACGGGGSSPGSDGGGVEAGLDAGIDVTEAGADAPPEAASDASDGSVDASTCSGTWSRLEDGLKGGSIIDAEFDPRTAGVAYAAGYYRVFSSTDSGDTWKNAGETPNPILQLAFPSDEPKTMLGASTGGLLESSDGGASWSVRSLGGENVTALYVVPSSPQVMYVGLNESGVLRSTDAGHTWTGVNNSLPYGWLVSLTGDPTNPNTVIAGVELFNNGQLSGYGQIARTTDGGMNWTVVSQPNTQNPLSLVTCPNDPSTVYAAISTGLAKSTDGGQTFPNGQVLLNGQGVAAVAVDTSCQTILASPLPSGNNPEGVYRSTDGGATWSGLLNNGMMLPAGTYPHPLAISSFDAKRSLASSGAGLFVTKDSGDSWSIASGVVTISGGAMSVSSTEPGKLWMAGGGAVWMRPQLGMPWQAVNGIGNSNAVFTVLADSTQAKRVFVGSQPGLYESTDDGATWVDAYPPQNIVSVGTDPTNPSVIYAGEEIGGVFKSTDAGKTWTASNGSLMPWHTDYGNYIWISAILVDPAAPSHVIIGTYQHGMYKSTDGGVSWNAVAPAAGAAVVNCLVDAGGKPDAFYACAEPVGILKSTDGGDTWMTLTNGLTSLQLAGLAVDGSSGNLFALSASAGVFRSNDQGATWQPFDTECLQTVLLGAGIAVVQNGSGRSLVVSGGGGVLAHPL